MQDLLICVDLMLVNLKSPNTTYRNSITLLELRVDSPAILVMEPIYNLHGLFDFLLSRRPSIEDGAIRTGAKNVLNLQLYQFSRKR